MPNHNDLITVNITLDPTSTGEASFTRVLGIFDGISLDGDRTRRYSSLADVTADQVAGFVSSDVVAAATAMFSQDPKPADIMIGKVNTGGGETYAQAVDLCIADDDGFYGLFIDDRTAANAVAVGAVVEADDYRVFFAQSADSDWLTTGVPAGFSTADGRERTVVVYHDTGAQWADAAYAANRLAFDPDETSAPFMAQIEGVTAYATAPTETQRNAARANNANTGLPYGPTADFWMDPGTNLNSRPVEEIVSADWFAVRLREAVAALNVRYSAKGKKIPVDSTGQSVILGEIEKLLAQGVTVGHFTADGTNAAEAEAITSGDLTDRRLRFKVYGTFAVSGRDFTFDVRLSRTAA